MVALVPPPKNTHYRPELEPRLAEVHRRVREAQIEAAAVLAEVRNCGHHRAVGCASMYEFGERRGWSAREVGALLQMEMAVKAEPVIGERVMSRRISADAAAALQQVVGTPTLLPEKEALIERAEHETAKELRSNISKRLDELRGTRTTWPLTVNLDDDRWVDFARVQDHASLQRGGEKPQPLTPAQVVKVLIDLYLDKYDILRRKSAARRVPDTRGVPGRYVPAEVRRAVYRRTRGRCVILECTNTRYMQIVQEVAVSRGGDQEEDNLGLRCPMHHRLKDSEIIHNEGSVEEPRYFNRFGEELRCRKPERLRGPPEKNGGLFT